MSTRYVSKYNKETGIVSFRDGYLLYAKVTPEFAEAEDDNVPYDTVEGSCFLYDDYSTQLKPGDVFYEIQLIEVNENARRQGVGTRLVKEFFKICQPKSVVLQAGVTREALYKELTKDKANSKLLDYIYENIVPFYESLGFTDVNNTTFSFEEMVPMLWPKSVAEEDKRRSEEFKRRNDESLKKTN